MAKALNKGTKRVKFSIAAAPDSAVYVAGTFNEWDSRKTPLKLKDGVWTTTVMLAPGRYEYKFVVNEVWCVDPECAEWAPNTYGSLNSVLTVV
jgi:1,4-alpha-glucan branching enzyme